VSETVEPTPVEGVGTDQPVKKNRWKWIAGGLVLLVVFLLILPLFSTLQPGYYGRYDNLHTRMENWRNSTHAKVSCAECHVNPGPVGFLTFAAKSVPSFYSQIITGPTENNVLGVPEKEACQKCHTNFRQVSPQGDLLIPHRAHVQVLEMDCAECHKDLVHSKNDQGFNRPEMNTCTEKCHNGKTATNECIKCHTQKQTPDSHKRADWLATHSADVNTVDCGSCHAWTPDFCGECHQKRPASHVGNWKTDHAAVAKVRGEGCLVCHGEKFCKECHD